jgi:hypothetical protein
LRYIGEAVKFEWSQPTFSKVMRVTALTPPSPSSPDYELELIEDQFATGVRTFGEPVGTEHVDPATGLDVAPPSASWDTVALPPDGVAVAIIIGNGGQLITRIDGAIIFGTYAPGGQYARLWVTEPDGTQTLSPVYISPDDPRFSWPVVAEGPYEFCIQTFSLHRATNEVKVCASINVVFAESGANAVTINGVVVTQNSEIMTGGW